MKKNSNKQGSKNNYDYLNFIRKNQQIVKQFKEISQLDRKVQDIKKMFMNTGNPERVTLQADRYAEMPIQFQDSLFNYRQRSKYEITSLKEAPRNDMKKDMDSPIKNRKETDETEKSGKTEIYSRNLWKVERTTNTQQKQREKQKMYEALSQVKFPKLSAKLQRREDDNELHSNSQSSLSVQKQKTLLKNGRKEYSQKLNSKGSSNLNANSNDWKKNYAPISLDNTRSKQSPARCKVNSLKLGDLNKNKINDKLIKTYYDYQNLLQLKERVAELLPTFKPLQSKKKDKVHIIHLQKQHQSNDLQQYLQANMIGVRSQRISQKLQKKNTFDVEGNYPKTSKNQNDEYREEEKNFQSTPQFAVNQQPDCLQRDPEQEQEQQQRLQRQLTLQKQQKPTQNSPSKPRTKKQIKIAQLSNPNSQEQTVYQNKIQSYRQFLFLINFAHRIFDPLIIRDDPEKHKIQNKYTFYIGPGNNGLLVKSLMKRRFWWTQVDDPKQANFVWTQLKINLYYQFERKTELVEKYDKLDSEHPYTMPKQKKLMKSKSNLNSNSNKKQEQPKVGGILRGQLPDGQKKIFTNADNLYLAEMLENAKEQNPQMKNFSKFETRLKYLPENFLRKREENYAEIRMHNHFFCNYEIGNKKALFYNLKHYYQIIGVDPYNSIPLTFHIKKGVADPEYAKFLKYFKKIKSDFQKAQKESSSKKKLSRNVWIIKPGQLSNRGNGITVIDQLYQLNTILKNKEKHTNGQQKTYIIQKYIEKPMLYKNRKFDIRHYMLISRLHGRMRAYWFSEGYIRTSSYEYNLEEVGDVMIHLTNDAVQKYGASYGKYEEGNKLSYAEFQRYLDNTYPEKKYSFIEGIYPRMREIAGDAVKSTYLWMDPDRSQHNFEVFGLDFMIDSNFNVWLIEVNTNPCLQISSGLLGRIIPTMIENALRLSLDPIFPPTAHYLNTIKYLAPDSPMERLQFQLIFDQARDGKSIEELLLKHGKANCQEIQEEDQTYENQGKEIQLGGELD